MEVLLRKVGDSNEVNISEAVDPKQYKVNEVKETENKWNQKRMHGQYMSYVKEKEELGSGLQNIRGPFLESPGNFTGPKSNIQIEM